MRKLLYNACIVCASCLLLFPCRVSANESTAIFEEVTDGTSNLDLELSSQTLTDTSSSNEVTIEGNLPEGAKVSVAELNTEDYLSVLAEYYNTSVENVFCVSALDITIETEDGEEFQPKDYNETVTVTIQDVETTENDKEVIHIEEAALDSVSTMLAENTYTEFETDSFSVYLIGGVSYDTSKAQYLNNAYASAYLFSDGRLLVTEFKQHGTYTDYPWYTKKGSIKTVSFADSVTFIGDYAFSGYEGLTGELVIPDSVTSIGNWAFAHCRGLTGDLIIPDSVTSIGELAFYLCVGLTGDLVIPDSVTSIEAKTFAHCSGFTGGLVIPDSVTTIGERAFDECSGFTGDLIIPDSVTSIGELAFQCCSGFTGDLILSDSVTSFSKGTFNYCSGLTGDLVIPDSVTTIGDSAFYGCSGLTGDLVIPDSVTSIDNYAFGRCSGFTGDLVIPDSVGSIGNYAFQGCSGLTDITISTGVTEIGSQAFYAPTKTVTKLKTENDVALNYDWAGDNRDIQLGLKKYTLNTESTLFGYLDTDTGELTVKGTGTALDIQLSDALGADVSLLKGISFDTNTIETIGTKWCYNSTVDSETAELDGADAGAPVFENLAGTLVLPTSLKTIGGFAFAYCSGFTGDLVIPSSVTFIDGHAFRSCTGFNGNLTLSEGLKTISERAFSYCSGFTGNLTIPSTVTSIGDSAFKNCSGFTGDLIIPSSITNINYSAFYGCSGLNGDLVIPDSVTSIGTYAFAYCSGFTRDLTIPNSVTTIGSCAFRKCTGFTGDLVIPNSVTSIGTKAFSYCSGLNGNLVISDSITNLEESTFAHCSGLTGDLTIPDGVTTIGDEAFYNCSGFSDKLTIPNTVMSLGNKAFSDCDNLTKLYIGNGVTTVGTKCFYVPNLTDTKLFTKSTAVKEHTWSADNRNVSAMNTFVVGLPQNISLSPTYLNSEDDPVYYASFNMEVSGQFEPDSYGKFDGVPSFTISSDSGDTRTVTTNITDTTLDSSGTIVVPVVLEAPNPDLSQEFTGTLNIATTLVECVPESLAD